MGLRYDIFMIQTPADTLHTRLMGTGVCTDRSDLLRQNRDWDLAWEQTLNAAWQKNAPEEVLAALHAEPDDPVLQEYRHPPSFQYRVWWMAAPDDPEVSIGMFTSPRLQIAPAQIALLALMHRAGIKEVLLVEYSSISGGGTAFRWQRAPQHTTKIPMLLEEECQFERYAARLDRKTGYPVSFWHQYVQNPKTRIPWSHEVLVTPAPS